MMTVFGDVRFRGQSGHSEVAAAMSANDPNGESVIWRINSNRKAARPDTAQTVFLISDFGYNDPGATRGL